MTPHPIVKHQNNTLLVVAKYKNVFHISKPKQKPPHPASTKAPNLLNFISMKPTSKPRTALQAITVHPTQSSV